MRDSQHDGQTECDGNSVSLLARQVMARVALREPDLSRRPVESVLTLLTETVTDPDPAAFEALRPLLKKARVTAIDLADLYFPEVARRLGCDWADDRRSFVGVSIGVARMQAVLRDIGADWASGEGDRARQVSVLVIVPEGEQHSFGAMVLTGQLRRRGVSVRLQLGPSAAELCRLVRDGRFDGALVSVACLEQLVPSRAIVKALKAETDGTLRVVVGGAILDARIDARIDVRVATGADAATNNLTEALAVFELHAECARVE